MDGNVSGGDNYNIDWDSDDDLEIENIQLPSNSTLTSLGAGSVSCNGEASSSRDPSQSKLINHFVGMGFPDTLVIKAIEENGEGNTELILETLLTYSALENSPERPQCLSSTQQPESVDSRAPPLSIDSDEWSADYDENLLDDISDSDSGTESWLNTNTDSLTDWEKKMMSLANMGYTVDEASIAMDRCGAEASIDELTDFICAAQMAKTADASYQDLPNESQANKKRKFFELMKKKKRRGFSNINGEEDEQIRLPNPMIGFGVPAEPCQQIHRTLPEDAIGPPYFYYENVALAPKGVWDTIKRFLYSVEPEFVDSKYFCAAARKRAYVHNLPIKNRFPILPLPPQTIHEALPLTRRWWPSWDTRTKLNCLQTSVGSAKMTERVRKALENWGDGEPPLSVQRYVLDECRKWNLVWVGKNKVAPLEPDEFEMLLGFPKNHTRGISRTDRYKSLGNSFQVDTVAYHLSVLKDIFPGGINVLSLFSGIGGAEMALYRLGIPLKNVVSVEKSEVNRTIVRGWWEQTNQKGNLIDYADVQEINGDMLEPLMNSFGGFDLVIGGSPCNNLAGSNRVSRDGLEGKESALFYDYFRILDLVKCILSRYQ